MPSPPPPLYEAILTGHFRHDASYHVHRPRGSGDYLLFLTLSGSGQLAPHLTLPPGHLALYHPASPQHYQTHPLHSPWEFLWAHFHPRPHWLPLLDWPPPDPPPPPPPPPLPHPAPHSPPSSTVPLLSEGPRHLRPPPPVFSRAARLLRRIHLTSTSTTPLSRDLSLALLEQLLILLAQSRPRHTLDPRIHLACQLLAQDPRSPFNLPAIAQAVSLSPSRVAHLFRTQTGQTPLQFHEHHRLDLARRLLSTTNLPIKQIAANTGYASPFYFSLRFKRATGLSPSQYRNP